MSQKINFFESNYLIQDVIFFRRNVPDDSIDSLQKTRKQYEKKRSSKNWDIP